MIAVLNRDEPSHIYFRITCISNKFHLKFQRCEYVIFSQYVTICYSSNTDGNVFNTGHGTEIQFLRIETFYIKPCSVVEFSESKWTQ